MFARRNSTSNHWECRLVLSGRVRMRSPDYSAMTFSNLIFSPLLQCVRTMCSQPHFQAFLQFHFDDHGSKMLRFGIAFPALPFVACFPSCMYKPCPLLVGLMARTDSACAHVDSRHDKREYTAFDHFPFHNHSPQNSSPRPGGWLILEV